MKYFVNQFYGDRLGGDAIGFPNVYPNMYIGLFTECESKGEGNCCGYYGAEYYLDTELLAYYVAEGVIYRPEKRISEVQGCYFKRKKIQIGSHMWTLVIEADTLEEAVEKFKNAEWRRWRLEDAGITVQDELDRYSDMYWQDCTHCRVIITDGKCSHIYDDEDIDTIPSELLNRVIKDSVISRSNEKFKLELKI